MNPYEIFEELGIDQFSVSFNRVDLSKYFFVKSDKGRGVFSREINLLSVAAKHGAHYIKSRYPFRVIEAEILFAEQSAESLRKVIEELNKELAVSEPVPLVFHDEPDREYFAISETISETYEIKGFHAATIKFVCPDPFKYGESKTYPFINGQATVTNLGMETASPVYEFEVLDDITHLDLITEEAYFRAGEPAPIDEPAYFRQTLILSDPLTNLIGWSDAVELDNGYVTGQMTANANGFSVSDFGEDLSPSKWQGPGKRKSLPQAIQNFRMDIEVELINAGNTTGMIEIYLIDAFGNTVGKVGIEDIWRSVTRNQAKFQLGNVEDRDNTNQYYRVADYPPAWNNFKGMLRLYRDGNRFRPYFALIQPNGKHVWVSSAYLYTDIDDEYSDMIVQIQIGMRKWPGTTPAIMKARNLNVWRLNDPTEGVPTIATAGDKIIIDTNDSSIQINGEDRKDLKDFGATFFKLKQGQTNILLMPSDKLSGSVTFKERYL